GRARTTGHGARRGDSLHGSPPSRTHVRAAAYFAVSPRSHGVGASAPPTQPDRPMGWRHIPTGDRYGRTADRTGSAASRLVWRAGANRYSKPPAPDPAARKT